MCANHDNIIDWLEWFRFNIRLLSEAIDNNDKQEVSKLYNTICREWKNLSEAIVNEILVE